MLADLFAIAVIVVSVWFAGLVHDAIMLLAGPGRAAQSAGGQLAGGLTDAGNAAAKVPFVGDKLKQPLLSAAEAGHSLAQAGQAEQHSVSRLAFLVALALIVLPVLMVLLLWLPPRIRWIRTSSQAQRLLDRPGGADLFALRALTGPLRALTTVESPDGDLVGAWRRGDVAVVDQLCRLGLKQAGLRPRPQPSPSRS